MNEKHCEIDLKKKKFLINTIVFYKYIDIFQIFFSINAFYIIKYYLKYYSLLIKTFNHWLNRYNHNGNYFQWKYLVFNFYKIFNILKDISFKI